MKADRLRPDGWFIVCASDEESVCVIGPYPYYPELAIAEIRETAASAKSLGDPQPPFHCGCWVHFPTRSWPPPKILFRFPAIFPKDSISRHEFRWVSEWSDNVWRKWGSLTEAETQHDLIDIVRTRAGLRKLYGETVSTLGMPAVWPSRRP